MLWRTCEDEVKDGLILGIQFLTRIPINKAVEFSKENIRNSLFFFPFIGILIGAIASLAFYFIGQINMEISAFLTVITLIILTGGLHIDGLSDMLDGFLSNRDSKKTLEIMKDSRVGAFGVMGIVLLILGKYIILKNISFEMWIIIVFSIANSRFVGGLIIESKKPARKGGLGELFHSSNPKRNIAYSGTIYVLILLFLDITYIIPLIITYIFAELISAWSLKKIGGLTGDVYGGIMEISELISLLSYWGLLLWI